MDNILLKSVVLDTINIIQNRELIAKYVKSGKPKQDDWNDYGVDISNFIMQLKAEGFTIVLVLGEEARGKSYGIKKLTPKTYLWFNADSKNPTFRYNEKKPEEAVMKVDFEKWYGSVNAPGALMRTMNPKNPMSYDSILEQLKVIKNGVKTASLTVKLDPNPIMFILGHLHTEKTANGTSVQKLRIIGKSATKYQIEGLADMLLLAEVDVENGKPVRRFRTQSFGYDNARCPEGMFEDENGNELVYIPNDYQLVVDAIDSYYNFPKPQAPVQTEVQVPEQIPAISTSPTPTPKPQTSK